MALKAYHEDERDREELVEALESGGYGTLVTTVPWERKGSLELFYCCNSKEVSEEVRQAAKREVERLNNWKHPLDQ